jgi:hypothetical protein
MKTTNAPVGLDERLYVVQDRDGDYLERIKGTSHATSKWQFFWTRDRAKAAVFSYEELCVRGPEVLSAKEQDKSLLMNLTVGHSGVKMVRIK